MKKKHSSIIKLDFIKFWLGGIIFSCVWGSESPGFSFTDSQKNDSVTLLHYQVSSEVFHVFFSNNNKNKLYSYSTFQNSYKVIYNRIKHNKTNHKTTIAGLMFDVSGYSTV